MTNSLIILFMVMIGVFIAFWFIFVCSRARGEFNEGFQWDILDVGPNAVDCYSQSENSCLSFSNCGLCYKNGIKKCIPGDVHGSFFQTGCDLWEYTNYYDGHIFDETKTTLTNSWDHFKHGYEVVYPMPADIFTLGD